MEDERVKRGQSFFFFFCGFGVRFSDFSACCLKEFFPPFSFSRRKRTGFPCHGLGQQRLPRSRRPIEQDARGRRRADRGEGRGVSQGGDGLGELALGAVGSSHVREGDPPIECSLESDVFLRKERKRGEEEEKCVSSPVSNTARRALSSNESLSPGVGKETKNQQLTVAPLLPARRHLSLRLSHPRGPCPCSQTLQLQRRRRPRAR